MSAYIADNQLPFKYTATGAIALNAVIFDWDTQEVEAPGLALHVHALGVGCVLTPEWSSDEVNWRDGWIEPTVLNSVIVATITAAGLYNVPKLARFIRLRVSTAQSSGTTTLSVTKSYADFRTATASGTSAMAGAAAHDAVILGNPVRIGARAITANYAAVATGDVADLVCTLTGAQITKDFSIPELDWQYAALTGGIVNTADVAVRVAQATGIRNYVTALQVRNTSAVATEFVIKEGATAIWRTQLPAAMTDSQCIVFPTPLKGATATAINVACITTGAAVYANLQGYSAP
jgi:hypothetical protein